MGNCTPARRRLEPEEVQQQTGGQGGMGDVLRPRRTLLLSVTGANSEHYKRRSIRNQSAATLHKHTVLSDGVRWSFQCLHRFWHKYQSTRFPVGCTARHTANRGSDYDYSDDARSSTRPFVWRSALLSGRLCTE